MTNLEQLIEEKCEVRVQIALWKESLRTWQEFSSPITEERTKLYDTIDKHIEYLMSKCERLDCEIKDEIESMCKQEGRDGFGKIFSDELQLLRDKISGKGKGVGNG